MIEFNFYFIEDYFWYYADLIIAKFFPQIIIDIFNSAMYLFNNYFVVLTLIYY